MTDELIPKIRAPFTIEQVKMLNDRQNNRCIHPYTCVCGAELIPITDGLKCPDCDYIQYWAFDTSSLDIVKQRLKL